MEEGAFNRTPATALSLHTRMRIALFLNHRRELLSHEKIPGDYRGLAELMQFAYTEIQNFGIYEEPTMKLLETWGKRQGATFGKLMELLQELQRYDLLAEVVPLLEEDAKAYQRRILMQRNGQHLIQDPEVTSGDSLNSSRYLTVDDFLSGEPTLYHAFMLHSDAPEDVTFAIELTRKLESEGMKIFLRNRNSLGGVDEYETNALLLRERCRRAIAVLTPEFLESSVCAFCTRWAHYLGIEHVQRKVIPLCLRSCATPLILQGTNVIDYTKAEFQDWEYLRLVASLKVVPETTTEAQQATTSSIKISI